MYDLVRVKAAELFGLVDEILLQDGRAWITVTGMSMFPFLREGRDSVELARAPFDAVKKGDIVLISRNNGVYVLHRVLKKEKDHFFIVGDAQQWVEGPLKPEQIHAVVTRIKKNQRIINCDNPLLKITVRLWLIVLPYRKTILKIGRFALKPFRRI